MRISKEDVGTGIGNRKSRALAAITSSLHHFITPPQSNPDQMPPLHLRHSEPAYREDVQ
jgi:hypothetical protein